MSINGKHALGGDNCWKNVNHELLCNPRDDDTKFGMDSEDTPVPRYHVVGHPLHPCVQIRVMSSELSARGEGRRMGLFTVTAAMFRAGEVAG